MNFNSLAYLIFFPVTVALYFILPKKLRWVLLLAASLFFYAFGNPFLLILIAVPTAVSYFCALWTAKAQKKSTKKLATGLSITVLLLVLVFFKYLNFLTETVFGVINLFGAQLNTPVFNLLLPLGLSFYTFQTISYAVDVYRGKIQPEKHFGYYALFVTFFPQLLSGPIERAGSLIPQLRADNKPELENFVAGGRRMLIGFFKKVIVADFCGVYVNAVFNNAEEANGFAVLISSILYAFQLYAEFSGYTDIAIGSARIMGIKLTENFDQPYRATSIKNFWNRWHITLSTWLRDYIYFPLGGSRCAKWKHYMNLLIVFLISGLWHGAALNFIIWGAFHGILRLIDELLKKPTDKLTEKASHNRFTAVLLNSFRVFRTFVLVTFGWLCFRANTAADLFSLIKSLFTRWRGHFVTYGAKLMAFGDATGEVAKASLNAAVGVAFVTVLAIIIMFMLDRRRLAPEKYEATPALAVVRYALIFVVIVLAYILFCGGIGGAVNTGAFGYQF